MQKYQTDFCFESHIDKKFNITLLFINPFATANAERM